MRILIPLALMMLQGIGGGAGIGGKSGLGRGTVSGISYLNTCDNGGSGVATVACTYATVPAGATLAIGVTGATAATGVTDTISGVPTSATQVGSNLSWDGGVQSSNIWYVKNTTAGSHTITATFAGATNFTRIKVMIFPGANASAPIDPFTAGQGIGTGTASGVALTNSFTTGNANDMVVAFVWCAGGPTLTTTTTAPYTVVVGTFVNSFGALYGIQTAASSHTASVNLSTNSQWAIMAMALKQ